MQHLAKANNRSSTFELPPRQVELRELNKAQGKHMKTYISEYSTFAPGENEALRGLLKEADTCANRIRSSGIFNGGGTKG